MKKLNFAIESINEMMKHFEGKKLVEEDIYSDYDRDEEGNLISCCGAILDSDIMICPVCKEHN